ncbi:MAG TPA: flagellar hook-associated protein FlgL [Dermatophilaceae bacterium]|nr:flagellar hook-associated protein FlgL [Dermatophilaceae bacterium]
MSSLRITQNSMNRTQLAGLNTSLTRLQHTQEQLTSGKRLNRPSDNPIDTVSAMRFRAEQRQLEQFGENITDGLARLQAADDALTRTVPMIQKLRTLAVAASNATNNASQRAAMAMEATQLREGIIQLANAQYAGRPVFAGTQNVGNAFDPLTGAFQGNTLPVLRQVTDAPGAAGQVNVSIDGMTAFATALNQTTGEIDQLIQAIQTGNKAGLDAGLAAMDSLQDTVMNAASIAGSRTNRLASLQTLNGQQDDSTRIALSKVEDVDFMRAAMDLNIQSNAYQAALNASAKMIQPSLMDFMR